MMVPALKRLIETHYGWALAIDRASAEVLLPQPGVARCRCCCQVAVLGARKDRAATRAVHQLRRKLGSDFIRNMRGVGYFLATEQGA